MPDIVTMATVQSSQAGGNDKEIKTVNLLGLANQIIARGRFNDTNTHTGDTNEFVHATITIPAGIMSASGRIRVHSFWKYTGTAGVKTMRVRLTDISGTILVAIANAASSLSAMLLWQFFNLGSTSANKSMDGGNTGYGASGASPVDMNIDTTQAFTIVLTNQNASAADTASLLGYDVELVDVK